ncbi:hypothetical protein D3C76_1435300 [compost metagenome]
MLGVVGDLPGSRTRQLVRLTFDERVEGERAVQVTGVLERAFNLNGALFGTGAGSRHRRRLGHGIEAVARRRLSHLVDQHRLYRCSGRFCRHNSGRSLVYLGLRQRSSHSGTDRRIGGGTRRRTATAAY